MLTSKTTISGNEYHHQGHQQRYINTVSPLKIHNHNLKRVNSNLPLEYRRQSSTLGCYQQQLELTHINKSENEMQVTNGTNSRSNGHNIATTNSVTSQGLYSPHPNELFPHHGKLSIQQTIERYDDSLACCLPPPSPAPNNDRYLVGLDAVTPTSPGNPNGSINADNCNAHRHESPYNSYECTHLHRHLAQSMSSSASTSSLSTNSGSLSCMVGNNLQCSAQTTLQTTSSSASLSNAMNYSHKNVPNAVNASIQACSSISPNTRFRMSERIRELQSAAPAKTLIENGSASRFINATHFLPQNNTTLVPSETYTYLSSTVHTPVKRYVPTPPPPNELYSDLPLLPTTTEISETSLTSSVNNKCSSSGSITNFSAHIDSTTAQHVNTLPYRLRMKCCTNDQQTNMHQQPPLHQHLEHMHALTTTDYYSTSPRSHTLNININSKCNIGTKMATTTYNGKELMLPPFDDQQLNTVTSANLFNKKSNNSSSASISSACISTCTSTASSAASTISPSNNSVNNVVCLSAGGMRQQAVSRSAVCMLSANDYSESIEHLNSNFSSVGSNSSSTSTNLSRVLATTAIEPTTNAAGSSNGNVNPNVIATTCLHCNTVRRTTGVHQTTQTTGPISPLPQMTNSNIGSNTNNHCLNSMHDQTSATLKLSASKTNISPLSPLANNNVAQLQSQHQNRDQSETHAVGRSYQQHQMYVHHLPSQQLQSVASQSTLLLLEHTASTVGSNYNQQPSLNSNSTNRQISMQNFPLQAHTSQVQTAPQQQIPVPQHYSRKKRLNKYLRREIARFFGVEVCSEAEECARWHGRHRRLALRRFGALKIGSELQAELNNITQNSNELGNRTARCVNNNNSHYNHTSYERPDILPAQDAENEDLNDDIGLGYSVASQRQFYKIDFKFGDKVERKATVASMLFSSCTYIIQALNKRQQRYYDQWSRSFAPAHVNHINNIDNMHDITESVVTLQEEEVFFDCPGTEQAVTLTNNCNNTTTPSGVSISASGNFSVLRTATSFANGAAKTIETPRQLYIGERVNGWRTSAIISTHNEQIIAATTQQNTPSTLAGNQLQQQQQQLAHNSQAQQHMNNSITTRSNRISPQLLDGVLENSRRPLSRHVKLFSVNDMDERTDHRPFFTYWINTVQILVLVLSLICYGIGPIGVGVEQKTGQVLVTSLSLQTVRYTEQRNVWIGPRNNDLVHMGAKFATCMRRDVRIIDVLLKTRRQERETACCIRNDDSGCVQSSQADCSVRGLFPTKSISTWKKWSPGESGPGGRISGSVCGLDPKYCDAPASIAPYEWPDDITKWPICRKTNSFTQRFRYKDHTAEHMICEVIGHPCCTGIYGECRITTREYCDFVNGYFHEEASLCSQISCLNNVCGMFPFFSVEVPDQFYRLFTSLCLHAGILHLAITITFQHIFLADLERLMGPIRTAIVYIGSGLAGNLTSAVLVPYKPEVGPLASLSGVVASLLVLLILMHWRQLRKPHVALFKLVVISALLFGIGTLPWQLNFAGLLAGVLCGIFTTIALVPFVSIRKYGRNSKINLIWSCIIFHMFMYCIMLVIFYVFPTELTNLNFGEVLSNSLNPHFDDNTNNVNIGNDDVISGISNGINNNLQLPFPQQQQQQQFRLQSDILENYAQRVKKDINSNKEEYTANREQSNKISVCTHM